MKRLREETKNLFFVFKKISKKMKKPLDKTGKMWYLIITKGKEKEIKTMKKITGYIIRNNRGKEIYVGENKAEAARLMARAAMRGWAWNLKEVSVEINEKPVEWWEVEGFKQNPFELGYNERL